VWRGRLAREIERSSAAVREIPIWNCHKFVVSTTQTRYSKSTMLARSKAAKRIYLRSDARRADQKQPQTRTPRIGTKSQMPRAKAPAPHEQLHEAISDVAITTTPALISRYQYRRRLPHLQKFDANLFVTFCTAARRELPDEARTLVLEHCLREGGVLVPAGIGELQADSVDGRTQGPESKAKAAGEGARVTQGRVSLRAIVVMPDHVHMLFEPLRGADGWPYPVRGVLQCFKGATAHRINKLLGWSGPLWEEESFDHVLRSDEDLKEKCEYMRQNPVRRGLAQRPEDYRWLWVSPELQ
jgi:putative transposase